MAAPSTADLVEYLGGQYSGTWDEDELTNLLAAETAAQAHRCIIPDPLPDDLREALLRRCMANLARRADPTSLASAWVVRGTDQEVRRLEAPYRRMGVTG